MTCFQKKDDVLEVHYFPPLGTLRDLSLGCLEVSKWLREHMSSNWDEQPVENEENKRGKNPCIMKEIMS